MRGALTPGIELARAIGDDVAFRYERSGYTTFALPIWEQHQYAAREIPDLLRRLLRKADAGPRREKAEPVVRAGFDVYLNGTRGSSSTSRNTVVPTISNRWFWK